MRTRKVSLPAARTALWCVMVLLTTAVGTATRSSAQPVAGFRESFPGTSLEGWASGAAISNPGTGGVLGPGDGYLLISQNSPSANLGAFGPTSAYIGNWTAAGITQVRLWLNDVNAPDTLEMHLALGKGAMPNTNFWQCNTGFIPPRNQWAMFIVDLTQPANFTQIGTTAGTFAAALQNVDRILIRHDKAPYVMSPDPVIGDVGLDEILLTNGTLAVAPGGGAEVSAPVRLARPYPNPSRGSVTLAMETSDSAPVRIQVVDAMGRVIRHADVASVLPGTHFWTWDGTDDRGVVAPAGYYRVRAIGPGGGTSQPLVRVR
jgi:FlgD Ig-like domain